VLVTNKASNIADDLDTLHLIVRSLPDAVKSLSDDDDVRQRSFELVFVLDECVAMGLKQPASLTNIHGALSMESHEEHLHKMIIDSKVSETKDVMKRKANEIDRQKAEGRPSPGPSPAPPYGNTSALGGLASGTAQEPGSGISPPDKHTARAQQPPQPPQQQTGPSGMQLSADQGASNILASLQAEGEEVPQGRDVAKAAATTSAGAPQDEAPASPQRAPRTRRKNDEEVQVRMDEKISAQMQADGMLEHVEVQGTMTLEVFEEAFGGISAALAFGSNGENFQYKTHPNIDKQQFQSERRICLKDQSRSFPLNSNLGVLKWRWQGTDETYVPFSLTCWPSPANEGALVSLEYEAKCTFDLYTVCISIPLPASHKASVSQVDGQTKVDTKRGVLEWTIDIVDETNATGNLEFTTSQADPESFFPIAISFKSPSTLCDIGLQSVMRNSDGEQPKLEVSKSLTADGYKVVSS
jgi:hypothetical protein